jgi:hypothetical protein
MIAFWGIFRLKLRFLRERVDFRLAGAARLRLPRFEPPRVDFVRALTFLRLPVLRLLLDADFFLVMVVFRPIPENNDALL